MKPEPSSADMRKNIFSKYRAAMTLRPTSRSEAVYLAGYCLEGFIKTALDIDQGGFQKIHILDTLVKDWRKYKLGSKLDPTLQNYIETCLNMKLGRRWHHLGRYLPDWFSDSASVQDFNEIFDVELPDLREQAENLILSYIGRP